MVLTTRTLQGAVLDLAVVPTDSKPHVVVSALENAVLPDDRVCVYWVAANNASPALHAALSWSFPSLRSVALDTCHLPMKYEAVAGITVQRAPGCSVGLSASSTCPSLRVWPHVVALEPFQSERNLQFTGDEVFFHDHL